MDKKIMDQVLEGKQLNQVLSEKDDSGDFEIDKDFVKQVEDIAEQEDWTVSGSENGTDWLFSIFSPAGRDFNIELDAKDEDELLAEFDRYIDGFDVSYETYIWLDNTGHGTHGAPNDMKDCYEDTEWCYNKAYELYERLRNEL